MITILFNHIPKTGGTTLRVIFNKVYGIDQVYFIESKNIGHSLEIFRQMNQDERSNYKVIAGHGAEFFADYIKNPFRLTIIREPVSLFVSQYVYLKDSPNSIFLHEVHSLKSIEDYLDYAIQKGQDNLLTRYLSGSISFLTNPQEEIPSLEKDGFEMLEKAKKALVTYDAVLDLETFDKGVFALSTKLDWKKIPLYRPLNQSKKYNKEILLSPAFKDQLINVLRYDVDLYNSFLAEHVDVGQQVDKFNIRYINFIVRQTAINAISRHHFIRQQSI